MQYELIHRMEQADTALLAPPGSSRVPGLVSDVPRGLQRVAGNRPYCRIGPPMSGGPLSHSEVEGSMLLRSMSRSMLQTMLVALFVAVASIAAVITLAGATVVSASQTSYASPKDFRHACRDSGGVVIETKRRDGVVTHSRCYHGLNVRSECDWTTMSCTEYGLSARDQGGVTTSPVDEGAESGPYPGGDVSPPGEEEISAYPGP